MRADAAARDVAGVEIALKPDSEWPQVGLFFDWFLVWTLYYTAPL